MKILIAFFSFFVFNAIDLQRHLRPPESFLEVFARNKRETSSQPTPASTHRYSLMSQPRKWCYYKKEEPFRKNGFDPKANKAIEQAFVSFMTTRANKVKINGDVFDFDSMVVVHNRAAYKLAYNEACVPYKVVLDGDPDGLTPGDRAFLSRIDQRLIVHRWFWWDNFASGDPFHQFIRDGAKSPRWTHYSPSDERKIEELYEVNSSSNSPLPFDGRFCMRFNCVYNGFRVMIQGIVEDENNSSLPENTRRRRPVIRASFCWCCDSSGGKGEPCWVPYTPDISMHLEEAFLGNKPEVDIKVGAEAYTVNFAQGIQFKIDYTFKRCKIRRFGTEIVDSFMNNVGFGDFRADDLLPPYWDFQEKQFLLSAHLNRSEVRIMSKMINDYQPCTE